MKVVMLAVVFALGDKLAAEPPKMKMTTEIPPGIVTPDDIETRLGDLSFFDGVPDDETVQKAYNFLDFQHAVRHLQYSSRATSSAAHGRSG